MTAPALLETYRPALTGHCYRMLGSVLDAEDAVQDTMLRSWKSLDRFNEQSSLKTWLYRIATNVCLDTLNSSNRTRVRPIAMSEMRPADSYNTFPGGNSRRLFVPTARTIASICPSGAHAASTTLAMISRGVPPASGALASVPFDRRSAISPVGEMDRMRARGKSSERAPALPTRAEKSSSGAPCHAAL
jgi:RNA polymerase sigma-70 factor (ECF subfamily)